MLQRISLCSGFMLLAAIFALAQSHVRIVTISLAQHQVETRRPPATGWTAAVKNAPVTEGESLRTLSDGVAEVQLECGSALRLTPGGEFVFTRLRLSDQGLPITTVSLSSGEAFFSIQKNDSRDFHVQLPGGVVSLPDGAAKLRLVVPSGGPASFEVLHGRVQVTAGGENATIKSSRRVELSPAGGYQVLPKLKADAWQKWSHHRDQLFERAMAASGFGPRFPAAIPPPPPDAAGDPDPMIYMNQEKMTLNAATADARKHARPLVPYCARH